MDEDESSGPVDIKGGNGARIGRGWDKETSQTFWTDFEVAK